MDSTPDGKIGSRSLVRRGLAATRGCRPRRCAPGRDLGDLSGDGGFLLFARQQRPRRFANPVARVPIGCPKIARNCFASIVSIRRAIDDAGPTREKHLPPRGTRSADLGQLLLGRNDPPPPQSPGTSIRVRNRAAAVSAAAVASAAERATPRARTVGLSVAPPDGQVPARGLGQGLGHKRLGSGRAGLSPGAEPEVIVRPVP
jgi:hypothetical protein